MLCACHFIGNRMQMSGQLNGQGGGRTGERGACTSNMPTKILVTVSLCRDACASRNEFYFFARARARASFIFRAPCARDVLMGVLEMILFIADFCCASTEF